MSRKEVINGIRHSTQRPYKSKEQGCAEPYQAAACVFWHSDGCGRSAFLSYQGQRTPDRSDLYHGSCHAPLFHACHV